MEKEEIKKIMKALITRLDNIGKWGGSHTSLKNLKKGLPFSLTTSDARKNVDKAIKLLINARFLLAKPSTGEIHVSLNAHKAREINEFLKS